MAKEELLLAIEQKDYTSFLDLLKQHGVKRNPVDLGEVFIELNNGQLNTIWDALHSWASEQVTKLVMDPDEAQDDLFNEAPHGQTVPEQNQETAPQGQTVPEQNQETVSQESQPQNDDGSRTVEGNAPEQVESAQTKEVEPYDERLMLGILEYVSIYLNTIKGEEAFIPDQLLELGVLLHGMVSVFEGKVQDKVVSICESWWLHELPEREHLVANAYPILIEASLAKSAKKKDVVAVYNMRGALHVLEFGEPFTELLAATAARPIYLSSDEGVRWLSDLFQWQNLVPRLHRHIKMVLPDCTRNQSAKCAEVYFRAWKKSEGDARNMIEENCLQDLMYAAVHVDPLGGRLSANLHHFLHHIHRHKRHHVVERTILSLYNPFLWRSLKAANGYVRMNAAGLLCDAFPLSDSSCTLEERDELMDRQYQTIIMLLTDPCHLVRITAIKGTCTILNNYWIMIPSQVIKTIFQKLLSDLLCDASSAEVRTQVIKGLTLLLDNNDAVPFLKEILPRITDSFDDINSMVRIAFIHLLLKIKALKIVRYWTLVPITHLLHRLEDDIPAVCKLLTQLLLSSFHPTQREDQELLQRCLALLEENRGAARRFYQYASRTLDLPSTVHFMLLIWRCLRNFIISQQAQDSLQEGHTDCGDTDTEDRPASSRQDVRKGSTSNRGPSRSSRGPTMCSENKENKDSGSKGNDDDDDEEDGSPLDDPMVIGGLLDTVVILWSTNAHRLAQPQNLKYLEALRMRISKSIPLFFKFFKDNKDVAQTLLYLSSFLPKSLVPTLVGHCLSQLRSLQQNVDTEDCYVTYINALCNWNRVDDVLELATDWLVEGFNTAVISNTKERRRSGRGVRFHETYTAQPLIALRIVRHILQHPLNKLAALSKNRPLVLDLADTMRNVKDLLSERIDQGVELSNLCSDVFLSECWSQYLSLVAVLHKPPEESQAKPSQTEDDEDDEEEVDTTYDSCLQVHDCLDWANRVLVPVLCEEEIGEKRKLRAGEESVKIAVDALNNLIGVSNSLIIIGVADAAFVYRLCSFTNALLKSDMCKHFWQNCLLVALEAYQYLQVYGTPVDIAGTDVVTPVDLINSCITSVAEYLREDKPIPKEADDIGKTMGMVLAAMAQNQKTTQIEIFQHLTATVVDCLCAGVDKMQGVDRDIKTINEMGSCIALLIGVCQARVKLSSEFMEALAHFLTDSVMDTTAILAIAQLLKVLSQDSGRISKYSLKQVVVTMDNIMSRILLPIRLDDTKDGDESTANIYEEYAKVTKEIVDDLKNSMGII